MGAPLGPLPAARFGLGALRPRATPVERGRFAILVALLVLTVAAWAGTIQQARTMGDATAPAAPSATIPMPAADDMSGIDMSVSTGAGDTTAGAMAGMAGGMSGLAAAGWSAGAMAAFVVAWTVMMAAMMFPAAAPMLLLYQTVAARRHARGGAVVPTWVFAAGYLLVWAAAGAVAFALVMLGGALADRLGSAERAAWAPVALGAVLVVAGAYQFTPLKGICLRHCQSPVGFVMTHWRDGQLGALRMGLAHGAFCLGCCWALFAVLVAAGVMSLAWMLLLTLVVFTEKVLPAGRRVSRAVGAAFLVLGALVATGAVPMPWTT